MAINVTTTSGISPELRTYYDMNLLTRLLPALVYLFFGQVRPMPAHEGQTVNYRRFNSLAAATTPLTEGVTPGTTALSITAVTVTPAQYGDVIQISDMVDFTSPDPVLTETGKLLGESAALTIDTLARDTLAAGTTLQYAAGRVSRVTVAAGDNINVTEIRKAVRTLQNNKVPKVTEILNPSTGIGTSPVNASYIGIIGPYALMDLKSDTRWLSVEQYGTATPLLPNEVGKLDDVRFVLTNNPKIFSGLGAAGIDVHGTLIMGSNSFGVISPFGIENVIKGFGEGGDDPLNQRMTSGWKTLFAVVILQQLAILRLEHAVTA